MSTAASTTSPAQTRQRTRTTTMATAPAPGGGGGAPPPPGGGGGGPPGGPGGPPIPPPVPPAFALTPGQVRPNDFIDYDSSQGIKLWNASTEPLPAEFNAESSGVKQFCELLTNRATESGWAAGNGNILTIPDANGVQHNLIEQYGQLTLEDVQTHVDGYIQGQNRRAQNAVQMFKCISQSLTEDARIKVLAEAQTYTRHGIEAGPIYFKLLTQKAIVDTRSTANYLRESLSSLDTYMASISSDIIEFNKYVKLNRDGLTARGERCDDLMVNLFKGYLAAGDATFVKYIQDYKDKYDDGQDMTVERLMELALNKFTNLKRANTWGALTADQEKIVALSAEMKTIKDSNLKLTKAIGQAAKQGTSSNKPKKGKGTDKKGKKKSKQNNRDRYAWKTVPPNDNAPKKTVNGHRYYYKTVSDKEYYWCTYHSPPCWVLHEPEGDGPSGCRNRQRQNNNNNNNEDTSSTRRVSFANALATIMEDLEQQE